MDLSNKTLGLLLVAAIVISIGGTIISLNRLDSVSTTGFATNNETGTVILNVPDALSIILTDDFIGFGDCTLNTSTGSTQVDSAENQAFGQNDHCTNSSQFPDALTIQNDGNQDANVQVRTNANGTTLFGTDDNWIAYKFDSGTCAGTNQSTYLNFTALSTNTAFCTNMTPTSTGDMTIRAYLNTSTAQSGGSMTVTFEGTLA